MDNKIDVMLFFVYFMLLIKRKLRGEKNMYCMMFFKKFMFLVIRYYFYLI